MNKFLAKLYREGKVALVEPSEEICTSYLQKSADTLTSAKLLVQHKLYENAISLSYYAMYNALLALLFKSGIKSENHGASIILLEQLFDKALAKVMSNAKRERIDKQYYITTETTNYTREAAEELFRTAETFTLKIRVFIRRLGEEEIEAARRKAGELLGKSHRNI